jgi:syntaxin of plants SYP5
MNGMISRSQHNQDRASLLSGVPAGGGTSTSGRPPGGETERTAELDNEGILRLQRQVMEEQDASLGSLSKTINSTKNIALAINDELSLQVRLLDDLDEDVRVTHSRMQAATQRVAAVLKRSGAAKVSCFIFILVAILVFLIVLLVKH